MGWFKKKETCATNEPLNEMRQRLDRLTNYINELKDDRDYWRKMAIKEEDDLRDAVSATNERLDNMSGAFFESVNKILERIERMERDLDSCVVDDPERHESPNEIEIAMKTEIVMLKTQMEDVYKEIAVARCLPAPDCHVFTYRDVGNSLQAERDGYRLAYVNNKPYVEAWVRFDG